MSWGTILFSFSGRINRAKYWASVLIYFAAFLIGGALVLALYETASAVSVAIIIVLVVVLFISGLSVAIKRLHDRDKSGWWVVIFYVAPLILGGLQNISIDPAMVIILSIISLAISIWAFVELGCLRGTAGPNRFGLDPLER